MHSILKIVFLEIQNKAIRPVLSGPVTYAGRSLEHSSCHKASLDIDIAHLGSQMLIVAYHDWLIRSANNLLRDQAWSHTYIALSIQSSILESGNESVFVKALSLWKSV